MSESLKKSQTFQVYDPSSVDGVVFARNNDGTVTVQMIQVRFLSSNELTAPQWVSAMAPGHKDSFSSQKLTAKNLLQPHFSQMWDRMLQMVDLAHA